ncbi:WD40-repeat-containing domain protein [Coprinopsis sp. MPI-PUGE-AT-0042]|nr:WD40-repeat-containing domain protein [Coprinopsis sp. MPI-PUGE-AT-0042]
MAQLGHHGPIVDVAWLARDEGLIVLTGDGIVHQWKETANNEWKWSRLVEAGEGHHSEQTPICFAYTRDRIAVSLPRHGVKLWIWDKPSKSWREQRSILRHNVTAIMFNAEGTALIGGTKDGVLWYCEVPNGTLRAYSFLKHRIISLDRTPKGEHILAGQQGGSAVLVHLRKSENTGVSELVYSHKELQAEPSEANFGAAFATEAQAVLSGTVEGCVLVWDRMKANIVYGLEHDHGQLSIHI